MSATRPRGLAASVKAVLVTLALWGFIPSRLASWLIQRGGLRDA